MKNDELDLREINITTADLLDEACKAARDKTFLHFPSRNFKATYGEFRTEVNRIANLLEEKGIAKGTNVAIMSGNSPELLHVSYAIMSMGAVWVPINSLLVGESLRYILDVCDCTFALVSSEYKEQIEQAVKHITRHIQILSLEEIYKLAKEQPPEYKSQAKPNDICYLLYTSGTTGFPKGVLHTHASSIRSGVATQKVLGVNDQECVFMQLPFFHMWAAMNLLGIIYFKVTNIIGERFDADTYWEKVIKYQITQDHWTGVMPLNLLKLPKSDLEQKANMTVLVTGGAMYNDLKERWPNIRFQSVYGLTEHPGATFVPASEVIPGSDGVPWYPDEILILDNNEKPLPQGETGEIVIRCKCGRRLLAYYKNSEATAITLRGDDVYTGDLGFIDKKGHLHFVGRKKDALRVRGEMVSVEHTEHLINQHPKIAESAITPYRPPEKEATKEDEIVAHVVLVKGAKLSALDFHAWSEKNLPRFMRPRYLVFRSSLPKTATERIQHFILKNEGITGATKLF